MNRDLTFDGAFQHLYVMTQSSVSAGQSWGLAAGRGLGLDELLVFEWLASSPFCCHSFSRFLWPPVPSIWTVHLVLLTGTHTAGGVCSSAGLCSAEA